MIKVTSFRLQQKHAKAPSSRTPWSKHLKSPRWATGPGAWQELQDSLHLLEEHMDQNEHMEQNGKKKTNTWNKTTKKSIMNNMTIKKMEQHGKNTYILSRLNIDQVICHLWYHDSILVYKIRLSFEPILCGTGLVQKQRAATWPWQNTKLPS